MDASHVDSLHPSASPRGGPSASRAVPPAHWIAAAAVLGSAALVVMACSNKAAAAAGAPSAKSGGTILVEELGRSRILRTGTLQAAFIGSFGLGARLTPWRHVDEDGAHERSVRLSLGLVPVGGGFGDMLLGGQDFSERAYWQMSSEEVADLLAFLERLAKARFIEAGEGVDSRFVDAKWGALHFRRFPDGSTTVFVFTNQDGNDIWSSIDLGVLRGALEQAVRDLEMIDAHAASVRFGAR
jgi:hypothetical protein